MNTDQTHSGRRGRSGSNANARAKVQVGARAQRAQRWHTGLLSHPPTDVGDQNAWLGAPSSTVDVHPLNRCFADVGMREALSRLESAMRMRLPGSCKAQLPKTTADWLLDCDEGRFASTAASLSLQAAADAARQWKCVSVAIRGLTGPRSSSRGLPPRPNQSTSADAAPPPNPTDASAQAALLRLSSARLCFGDALEAYAAWAATQVCGPNQFVGAANAHAAEFAQLMHDSFLAAVFTSVHAEHVHLMLEAKLDPLFPMHHDMPTPGLCTLPSSATFYDLTGLLERASNLKACPKATHAAVGLLTRCTNIGSRGWDPAVTGAFQSSESAQLLCEQALRVALTGLHPAMHPAARPTWRGRLETNHRAFNSRQDVETFGKTASGALKEAMRLLVACLFATDPASTSALSATPQSVDMLGLPPLGLPATALQACMHAFVHVAHACGTTHTTKQLATALVERMPRETKTSRSTVAATTYSLPAAGYSNERRAQIHAAFFGAAPVDQEVHGTVGHGDKDRSASHTSLLCYSPSWLGGRIGSVTNASVSACSVVSSVLGASFRSAFVPFWMHAQMHGHRASRLDAVQYDCIHGHNQLHQLVRRLPDRARLRIQRLALRIPSATLLGIADVVALVRTDPILSKLSDSECERVRDERSDSSDDELNFDGDSEDDDECKAEPASTSESHSQQEQTHGDDACHNPTVSRAFQEAEAWFLARGAREAAFTTAFAQTAMLKSELVCYSLGEETRRQQAAALALRFRNADVCSLPEHATRVFVCCECKRIVNAVQNGSGKDTSFTELGLASSMLRHLPHRNHEMRCAKRSSAALRTAVNLETAATDMRAETLPAVADDQPLPSDLRPVSVIAAGCGKRVREDSLQVEHQAEGEDGGDASSDVAKLRRDIKNAFEQRPTALACGDTPLVSVSVFGRAIRVYGQWYALCSFCASLTLVTPDSRYKGEICCNRCDSGILYGEAATNAVSALRPVPVPPTCRLCGKVEPDPGRWRRVRSPLDSGGRNACVPPPLRLCHYCPSHWRPWLTWAHCTMSTKDIFSHIVHRAKPIYGASMMAETGKRTIDDAERAFDMKSGGKSDAGGSSVARKRPRGRKLQGPNSKRAISKTGSRQSKKREVASKTAR